MLAFCGQDYCSIDANGRVKFSPALQRDFHDHGNGTLVLHCLPELALAVYPEDVYIQMRRSEPRPAERAAGSLVFRRNLRRFGAMSQLGQLSRQGRITIPPAFRSFTGLEPQADVVIVGVEIGVEIWVRKRWQEELLRIQQHTQEKGEREMLADLDADSGISGDGSVGI